jgi:Family of unknown function (DUF6247)
MSIGLVGEEHEPCDPEVILAGLPKPEHAEFLRRYRLAVDAARDPVNYRELRRMLRSWCLRSVAVNRPGYREALHEVKNGTGQTTPIEEVFPDWRKRIRAARPAPDSHR